ncbi:porin [Variovorax sp. PvP013]|uniref:porin n=1 Tax=Variovorax sp. PvP013 TaxID=3156435 RepID=UPI003D222733
MAATTLPVDAQTSPPVPAASESPWRLSGFGTLGVVRQSGGNDWGFVRNSTQLGASSRLSATPDSRLGLQMNWNPGTRWEAAAQGVLLSRPSGTPIAESVEWAYIGYRPRPDTRVRIGRTSPDIFLFADSRNVGFALPWARPPVDFYGFAPLVSIDGVDLAQHWYGDDSTWRARLTGGSVRTGITDVEGRRLKVKGNDALAMSLSREEGGLLLKASYLRSRFQVDTGADAAQLRDGLAQLSQLPVPGLAGSLDRLGQNLWTGGSASYWALAAQYDTGPWTFTAEGSRLRVPRSPLNALRAYVSAGYRLGSFTYYGVVGRVRPDKAVFAAPDVAGALAPVLGSEGAQEAQSLVGLAALAGDNYRYDQRTVGAGLRWDFMPNAALKLQVDRFDVRRNGAAGWRFADDRGGRGTLVSVLVDFVWGQ